jgi:hypothetical protein
MSYVESMKLSLIFVSLTGALAVGCAAPTSADDPSVSSSEAALGESGAVHFRAGGVSVDGTLQKGKTLRIDYDAARLTACRGDQYGHPAWTITGYFQIGDGPVRSFEAGGFSPTGGSSAPVLALDASGDLQIWFQNTSVWGCSAYDSDYGKNFHFAVAPAANEPGWIGNARYVMARQTCNGPCDGDFRDASAEILYDTWSRQRAAIRELYFEVWKDGVTDHDDGELWKKLDVQVHSRVAGTSAWQTAYVSFDRRVGNNARYGLDLTSLDPIVGLVRIEDPSKCPSFPLVKNGGYVDATVELYFTVNGVELRPAGGGAFHVRYENYADAFAPCVPG